MTINVPFFGRCLIFLLLNKPWNSFFQDCIYAQQNAQADQSLHCPSEDAAKALTILCRCAV